MKIRNEFGVALITKKLREGILSWFKHVHEIQPSVAIKIVETIKIEGVRRRGRTIRKWVLEN